MTDYLLEARNLFNYSQSIRRDLHRHPELGLQEIRTAGVIARELMELGLEVTTGVAETGVVALLEGNASGPTLLLRFDMDALPIQEETGKDYASTTAGCMHACGHDGHVAVGLTAARLLNAQRARLHGRVKLVFQPAEEGPGGAERMVAAGVLQNPAPEHTLALHIWNDLPIGTVAIVPGPLMAGCERFVIKLAGRGGHGALPHQTIDPIAAAAQIITALQTVVSRNISPLQAAVVSVTQVKAGEAHNVIPQTAELQGTIRTFEPEVRELVLKRFRQLVVGVAEGMGCQADIQLIRLTPPVINDPLFARRLGEKVQKALPEVRLDTTFRTMVSEDMAFMMEQVPGCYMMVGGANPARQLDFPHHHPKFDFDEEALVWASALMAILTADILS